MVRTKSSWGNFNSEGKKGLDFQSGCVRTFCTPQATGGWPQKPPAVSGQQDPSLQHKVKGVRRGWEREEGSTAAVLLEFPGSLVQDAFPSLSRPHGGARQLRHSPS